MKIFDTTLARLERSLDVRLVRHNVIASNVANADTPDYKPKDIDFKAAMAAATGGDGGPGTMRATDARHIPVLGAVGGAAGLTAAEIPVTDGAMTSAGMDGNRVDLDRTMTALAENSLQYGAGARAAGKKLAILRYVVSDGNG